MGPFSGGRAKRRKQWRRSTNTSDTAFTTSVSTTGEDHASDSRGKRRVDTSDTDSTQSLPSPKSSWLSKVRPSVKLSSWLSKARPFVKLASAAVQCVPVVGTPVQGALSLVSEGLDMREDIRRTDDELQALDRRAQTLVADLQVTGQSHQRHDARLKKKLRSIRSMVKKTEKLSRLWRHADRSRTAADGTNAMHEAGQDWNMGMLRDIHRGVTLLQEREQSSTHGTRPGISREEPSSSSEIMSRRVDTAVHRQPSHVDSISASPDYSDHRGVFQDREYVSIHSPPPGLSCRELPSTASPHIDIPVETTRRGFPELSCSDTLEVQTSAGRTPSLQRSLPYTSPGYHQRGPQGGRHDSGHGAPLPGLSSRESSSSTNYSGVGIAVPVDATRRGFPELSRSDTYEVETPAGRSTDLQRTMSSLHDRTEPGAPPSQSLEIAFTSCRFKTDGKDVSLDIQFSLRTRNETAIAAAILGCSVFDTVSLVVNVKWFSITAEGTPCMVSGPLSRVL